MGTVLHVFEIIAIGAAVIAVCIVCAFWLYAKTHPNWNPFL